MALFKRKKSAPAQKSAAQPSSGVLDSFNDLLNLSSAKPAEQPAQQVQEEVQELAQAESSASSSATDAQSASTTVTATDSVPTERSCVESQDADLHGLEALDLQVTENQEQLALEVPYLNLEDGTVTEAPTQSNETTANLGAVDQVAIEGKSSSDQEEAKFELPEFTLHINRPVVEQTATAKSPSVTTKTEAVSQQSVSAPALEVGAWDDLNFEVELGDLTELAPQVDGLSSLSSLSDSGTESVSSLSATQAGATSKAAASASTPAKTEFLDLKEPPQLVTVDPNARTVPLTQRRVSQRQLEQNPELQGTSLFVENVELGDVTQVVDQHQVQATEFVSLDPHQQDAAVAHAQSLLETQVPEVHALDEQALQAVLEQSHPRDLAHTQPHDSEEAIVQGLQQLVTNTTSKTKAAPAKSPSKLLKPKTPKPLDSILNLKNLPAPTRKVASEYFEDWEDTLDVNAVSELEIPEVNLQEVHDYLTGNTTEQVATEAVAEVQVVQDVAAEVVDAVPTAHEIPQAELGDVSGLSSLGLAELQNTEVAVPQVNISALDLEASAHSFNAEDQLVEVGAAQLQQLLAQQPEISQVTNVSEASASDATVDVVSYNAEVAQETTEGAETANDATTPAVPKVDSSITNAYNPLNRNSLLFKNHNYHKQAVTKQQYHKADVAEDPVAEVVEEKTVPAEQPQTSVEVVSSTVVAQEVAAHVEATPVAEVVETLEVPATTETSAAQAEEIVEVAQETNLEVSEAEAAVEVAEEQEAVILAQAQEVVTEPEATPEPAPTPATEQVKTANFIRPQSPLRPVSVPLVPRVAKPAPESAPVAETPEVADPIVEQAVVAEIAPVSKPVLEEITMAEFAQLEKERREALELQAQQAEHEESVSAVASTDSPATEAVEEKPAAEVVEVTEINQGVSDSEKEEPQAPTLGQVLAPPATSTTILPPMILGGGMFNADVAKAQATPAAEQAVTPSTGISVPAPQILTPPNFGASVIAPPSMAALRDAVEALEANLASYESSAAEREESVTVESNSETDSAARKKLIAPPQLSMGAVVPPPSMASTAPAALGVVIPEDETASEVGDSAETSVVSSLDVEQESAASAEETVETVTEVNVASEVAPSGGAESAPAAEEPVALTQIERQMLKRQAQERERLARKAAKHPQPEVVEPEVAVESEFYEDDDVADVNERPEFFDDPEIAAIAAEVASTYQQAKQFNRNRHVPQLGKKQDFTDLDALMATIDPEAVIRKHQAANGMGGMAAGGLGGGFGSLLDSPKAKSLRQRFEESRPQGVASIAPPAPKGLAGMAALLQQAVSKPVQPEPTPVAPSPGRSMIAPPSVIGVPVVETPREPEVEQRAFPLVLAPEADNVLAPPAVQAELATSQTPYRTSYRGADLAAPPSVASESSETQDEAEGNLLIELHADYLAPAAGKDTTQPLPNAQLNLDKQTLPATTWDELATCYTANPQVADVPLELLEIFSPQDTLVSRAVIATDEEYAELQEQGLIPITAAERAALEAGRVAAEAEQETVAQEAETAVTQVKEEITPEVENSSSAVVSDPYPEEQLEAFIQTQLAALEAQDTEFSVSSLSTGIGNWDELEPEFADDELEGVSSQVVAAPTDLTSATAQEDVGHTTEQVVVSEQLEPAVNPAITAVSDEVTESVTDVVAETQANSEPSSEDSAVQEQISADAEMARVLMRDFAAVLEASQEADGDAVVSLNDLLEIAPAEATEVASVQDTTQVAAVTEAQSEVATDVAAPEKADQYAEIDFSGFLSLAEPASAGTTTESAHEEVAQHQADDADLAFSASVVQALDLEQVTHTNGLRDNIKKIGDFFTSDSGAESADDHDLNQEDILDLSEPHPLVASAASHSARAALEAPRDTQEELSESVQEADALTQLGALLDLETTQYEVIASETLNDTSVSTVNPQDEIKLDLDTDLTEGLTNNSPLTTTAHTLENNSVTSDHKPTPDQDVAAQLIEKFERLEEQREQAERAEQQQSAVQALEDVLATPSQPRSFVPSDAADLAALAAKSAAPQPTPRRGMGVNSVFIRPQVKPTSIATTEDTSGKHNASVYLDPDTVLANTTSSAEDALAEISHLANLLAGEQGVAAHLEEFATPELSKGSFVLGASSLQAEAALAELDQVHGMELTTVESEATDVSTTATDTESVSTSTNVTTAGNPAEVTSAASVTTEVVTPVTPVSVPVRPVGTVTPVTSTPTASTPETEALTETQVSSSLPADNLEAQASKLSVDFSAVDTEADVEAVLATSETNSTNTTEFLGDSDVAVSAFPESSTSNSNLSVTKTLPTATDAVAGDSSSVVAHVADLASQYADAQAVEVATPIPEETKSSEVVTNNINSSTPVYPDATNASASAPESLADSREASDEASVDTAATPSYDTSLDGFLDLSSVENPTPSKSFLGAFGAHKVSATSKTTAVTTVEASSATATSEVATETATDQHDNASAKVGADLNNVVAQVATAAQDATVATAAARVDSSAHDLDFDSSASVFTNVEGGFAAIEELVRDAQAQRGAERKQQAVAEIEHFFEHGQEALEDISNYQDIFAAPTGEDDEEGARFYSRRRHHGAEGEANAGMNEYIKGLDSQRKAFVESLHAATPIISELLRVESQQRVEFERVAMPAPVVSEILAQGREFLVPNASPTARELENEYILSGLIGIAGYLGRELEISVPESEEDARANESSAEGAYEVAVDATVNSTAKEQVATATVTTATNTDATSQKSDETAVASESQVTTAENVERAVTAEIAIDVALVTSAATSQTVNTNSNATSSSSVTTGEFLTLDLHNVDSVVTSVSGTGEAKYIATPTTPELTSTGGATRVLQAHHLSNSHAERKGKYHSYKLSLVVLDQSTPHAHHTNVIVSVLKWATSTIKQFSSLKVKGIASLIPAPNPLSFGASVQQNAMVDGKILGYGITTRAACFAGQCPVLATRIEHMKRDNMRYFARREQQEILRAQAAEQAALERQNLEKQQAEQRALRASLQEQLEKKRAQLAQAQEREQEHASATVASVEVTTGASTDSHAEAEVSSTVNPQVSVSSTNSESGVTLNSASSPEAQETTSASDTTTPTTDVVGGESAVLDTVVETTAATTGVAASDATVDDFVTSQAVNPEQPVTLVRKGHALDIFFTQTTASLAQEIAALEAQLEQLGEDIVLPPEAPVREPEYKLGSMALYEQAWNEYQALLAQQAMGTNFLAFDRVEGCQPVAHAPATLQQLSWVGAEFAKFSSVAYELVHQRELGLPQPTAQEPGSKYIHNSHIRVNQVKPEEAKTLIKTLISSLHGKQRRSQAASLEATNAANFNRAMQQSRARSAARAQIHTRVKLDANGKPVAYGPEEINPKSRVYNTRMHLQAETNTESDLYDRVTGGAEATTGSNLGAETATANSQATVSQVNMGNHVVSGGAGVAHATDTVEVGLAEVASVSSLTITEVSASVPAASSMTSAVGMPSVAGGFGSVGGDELGGVTFGESVTIAAYESGTDNLTASLSQAAHPEYTATRGRDPSWVMPGVAENIPATLGTSGVGIGTEIDAGTISASETNVELAASTDAIPTPEQLAALTRLDEQGIVYLDEVVESASVTTPNLDSSLISNTGASWEALNELDLAVAQVAQTPARSVDPYAPVVTLESSVATPVVHNPLPINTAAERKYLEQLQTQITQVEQELADLEQEPVLEIPEFVADPEPTLETVTSEQLTYLEAQYQDKYEQLSSLEPVYTDYEIARGAQDLELINYEHAQYILEQLPLDIQLAQFVNLDRYKRLEYWSDVIDCEIAYPETPQLTYARSQLVEIGLGYLIDNPDPECQIAEYLYAQLNVNDVAVTGSFQLAEVEVFTNYQEELRCAILEAYLDAYNAGVNYQHATQQLTNELQTIRLRHAKEQERALHRAQQNYTSEQNARYQDYLAQVEQQQRAYAYQLETRATRQAELEQQYAELKRQRAQEQRRLVEQEALRKSRNPNSTTSDQQDLLAYYESGDLERDMREEQLEDEYLAMQAELAEMGYGEFFEIDEQELARAQQVSSTSRNSVEVVAEVASQEVASNPLVADVAADTTAAEQPVVDTPATPNMDNMLVQVHGVTIDLRQSTADLMTYYPPAIVPEVITIHQELYILREWIESFEKQLVGLNIIPDTSNTLLDFFSRVRREYQILGIIKQLQQEAQYPVYLDTVLQNLGVYLARYDAGLLEYALPEHLQSPASVAAEKSDSGVASDSLDAFATAEVIEETANLTFLDSELEQDLGSATEELELSESAVSDYEPTPNAVSAQSVDEQEASVNVIPTAKLISDEILEEDLEVDEDVATNLGDLATANMHEEASEAAASAYVANPIILDDDLEEEIPEEITIELVQDETGRMSFSDGTPAQSSWTAELSELDLASQLVAGTVVNPVTEVEETTTAVEVQEEAPSLVTFANNSDVSSLEVESDSESVNSLVTLGVTPAVAKISDNLEEDWEEDKVTEVVTANPNTVAATEAVDVTSEPLNELDALIAQATVVAPAPATTSYESLSLLGSGKELNFGKTDYDNLTPEGLDLSIINQATPGLTYEDPFSPEERNAKPEGIFRYNTIDLQKDLDIPELQNPTVELADLPPAEIPKKSASKSKAKAAPVESDKFKDLELVEVVEVEEDVTVTVVEVGDVAAESAPASTELVEEVTEEISVVTDVDADETTSVAEALSEDKTSVAEVTDISEDNDVTEEAEDNQDSQASADVGAEVTEETLAEQPAVEAEEVSVEETTLALAAYSDSDSEASEADTVEVAPQEQDEVPELEIPNLDLLMELNAEEATTALDEELAVDLAEDEQKLDSIAANSEEAPDTAAEIMHEDAEIDVVVSSAEEVESATHEAEFASEAEAQDATENFAEANVGVEATEASEEVLQVEDVAEESVVEEIVDVELATPAEPSVEAELQVTELDEATASTETPEEQAEFIIPVPESEVDSEVEVVDSEAEQVSVTEELTAEDSETVEAIDEDSEATEVVEIVDESLDVTSEFASDVVVEVTAAESKSPVVDTDTTAETTEVTEDSAAETTEAPDEFADVDSADAQATEDSQEEGEVAEESADEAADSEITQSSEVASSAVEESHTDDAQAVAFSATQEETDEAERDVEDSVNSVNSTAQDSTEVDPEAEAEEETEAELEELTTTSVVSADNSTTLTNSFASASVGAFSLGNLLAQNAAQPAKLLPDTKLLESTEIFADEAVQLNNYIRYLRPMVDQVDPQAQIVERLIVANGHRYEIIPSAKVGVENFVTRFQALLDSTKNSSRLQVYQQGTQVYIVRKIETAVRLVDLVTQETQAPEIAVGLDLHNHKQTLSLAQKNTMICGQGASKRNLWLQFLATLVYQHTPEDLELVIFADRLEQHPVEVFNLLPHLLHPIFSHGQEYELICLLAAELINRRRKCAQLETSDFIAYNQALSFRMDAGQLGLTKIKPLYVFIDSLSTSFIKACDNPVDSGKFNFLSLLYIMQQGRKLGINFVNVNSASEVKVLRNKRLFTQQLLLDKSISAVQAEQVLAQYGVRTLSAEQFMLSEGDEVYNFATVSNRELQRLADFWSERLESDFYPVTSNISYTGNGMSWSRNAEIHSIRLIGNNYQIIRQELTNRKFYRQVVIDELLAPAGDSISGDLGKYLNFTSDGDFLSELLKQLEELDILEREDGLDPELIATKLLTYKEYLQQFGRK